MAAAADALDVKEEGGAITFPVAVSPRASKSSVEGIRAGALKVRLAAAPVEGAANEELAVTLGGFFGAPKSAVRIIRGERSKRKIVRVEGVTAAKAFAALKTGGGKRR